MGAIISFLKGTLSPESAAALSVYNDCLHNIYNQVSHCASGKELIAKGFEQDVWIACQLNTSNNVPVLREGAYVSAGQVV